MISGRYVIHCPYCFVPVGAEYILTNPPQLGSIMCGKCKRVWAIATLSLSIGTDSPPRRPIGVDSGKNRITQEWLDCLPLKQQTVLLSALRGCDGKSKEDCSKKISRAIRGLVLKNADSSSSFMHHDDETLIVAIDSMLFDLDAYPVHYVLHLVHAIEIIGYKYPETSIASFWLGIYHRFCNAMHVGSGETEEVLDERLKDNFNDRIC